MKRRWSAGLATAALAAFCLTKPAMAFLGIGDIVFDPSVYAEAVEQVVQLEQQYAQLVATYQMISNQYNHALRMAQQVPVTMGTAYRAVRTPWQNSAATNTYGTTSGWIAGINTGVNTFAGYLQAIEALEAYGAALNNIPEDQRARIETQYATVELTDGANVAAMTTLGSLRANAPAVEAAIQRLEDDSLSSAPEMNTEIAVLNKLSAAGLIALRNSQDTNKLLAALAEGQMIEAKRKRDAEAQAIRNHIRFMADGQAVILAQSKDASLSMENWRMP